MAHCAGVSTQRLRRTSGQSLVETMFSLMIIMMIVVGLIHLSMLAATRHLSNYAAFAAARASMYDGFSGLGQAEGAASDITSVLPRGTYLVGAMPGMSNMRVEVSSPFSYPLFSSGSFGGVMVAAQAPMYKQPYISEQGDNGSPF